MAGREADTGAREAVAVLQAEVERLGAQVRAQERVLAELTAAVERTRQPSAAPHGAGPDEDSADPFVASPPPRSARLEPDHARTTAEPDAGSASPEPADATATGPPTTVGRRQVLRGVALAAGAAGAGTAALVATASPAAAATVTGTGSPGVLGDGTPSGTGVKGMSESGLGVYGVATSGTAGYFLGASGTGVVANSRTALALTANGNATAPIHITLDGGPATKPALHGTPYIAGTIIKDQTHTLWYCTASGTPGTWRRMGGPGTAGQLTLIKNLRIYDSRAGVPPAGVQKGKFANHEERVIQAALGGAVPTGATGVLINATATNTNPGGFFAFFNNSLTWPGNSSLNWGLPGSTIANLAIVAVDAAASFKARMEGAGGADLVIDCLGYYA